MSRHIGQQVVVENRTGAGGTVGMDTAMKSPPDGYTVLITNDNAASAPHIMSLPYDYTKELTPVSYLARQQQVLGIHPSVNVNTVAELIAYVKSTSGVGYATSGVGSNQHIIGEWFKKETGLKLDHIPYKGAGQAINDLVAGHVKLAWLGPTALVPQAKPPERSSCWRRPRRSARRICRAFRRSRRPASRAWCSKPGTPPSCRRARRRRSSRSSTPR